MRAIFTILAAVLLTMPAAAQTRYAWVGGTAGEWTDAANWSPAGVPAATDTAVVESASADVVTLTAHTTVAGLEIAGFAAVGGDFDLTVTDRLLWSSDSFDAFRGVGTITVAAGATLRMATASRLHIGVDRVIVNDGLAVWETPARWDAGRFVNHGTLDLAFEGPPDFMFVFVPGTEAFTNHATGVIRRTGSGDARYGATLVNDGLIRIENGSFDLSSSTTGAGAIEVEPGATLRAANGTHTQASVTGAAVEIRAGELAVTDTYTTDATTITGGLLTLDTGATITDLVLEGGTLGGSGNVTVTGSLAWNGGDMGGSGTTILGPTIPLTIGGSNPVSLGGTRTLRTEGPVTWTGDARISSGTFENAGTLTSSGPGEREAFFVTFRNTGTLVHDGGTLRFANSPMDNEGVVRIEDGVLSLNSNGTDTGRYEIAEAGRMEYISGTQTLTETAEVVGTGTVAFTGGTVVNRATWRPGALPGTLTIDSDWPALAPDGVLEIEIGGATPGTEFDQLDVSGAATLGGILRVSLTDGFTPQLGDRFRIIAAASGATGAFDAVELPGGLEAFVEASATGAELVIGTPVANETEPSLPTTFALHAPYPNPATAHVVVRYDVPSSEALRVAVYDVLGREVAVLAEAAHAAGQHELRLQADHLPSGLYLVRMTAADGFTQTRSMTLLR